MKPSIVIFILSLSLTQQALIHLVSASIDECSLRPNVCQNGATCVNLAGSYQCQCVNGWEGPDCSKNVDDCAAAACESGAVCHDKVGYFYCECPPGKTGLLCQLDDGCYHNPCQNNATCTSSTVTGRATCECPKGFTGADCSIDIDECAAGSPCEHGGSCVNTPGSFRCDCPRGFSGTRCEININECENNPCLNEGTCLDEKGGFKCICTPGFTGQRCQTDIDDCASNPCHNGAVCKDYVNSYRCFCQSGFWGERCEFSDNTSQPHHHYFTPCPVGWDGPDCDVPVSTLTQDYLPPTTPYQQVLLVIRVEPAIEIGVSPESRWDMELSKMLRNVSLVTKTMLKIQNFRQIEEGRGTEIELIADIKKCQTCYNSTELIAKVLGVLKARSVDASAGALKITDVRSQIQQDSNPNPESMPAVYFIFFGCLISVCFVALMAIGNKQKGLKEKAVVWFPEGFKPMLSSRNKDPTNRKANRGVSTLQALGGNFFRGIKRNERKISTDPNGLHSTDIYICNTETPNGGGIYNEPYDYDQYGTYNGTDSTVINTVGEPLTPPTISGNPIDIEGPHGFTPLMIAAMGPPPPKDSLNLVSYGTTGEMNGSSENSVTQLLKLGAQLNIPNRHTGETSLHLAARHGRVDSARGLLERCDSQDVNSRDVDGRTPLHAAIAADSLGVFELLIRCRGTDLNAQSNDGTTPLILAVKVDSYSMIEELILNECEVTKTDSRGRTALHWAAATNNQDAVRRLLAVTQTNKDAGDLDEATPLFLAAREGARGAVEILLNHNANRDICDQEGVSPIEIARSRKHKDIVKLLAQPPMRSACAPLAIGDLKRHEIVMANRLHSANC